MLKSKLLIGGMIGLASFILIPQQLSHGEIVSELETHIETRTKEIKVEVTNEVKLQEEVEFISIRAETIEEDEDEITEYIGKFTISYYCSCNLCNGKWTNMPAKNGEPLKENYTIAVDTDVIPLNTWVYIDNIGYRKACDTGGAINGNKIDVYVDDHDLCYELGIDKGVQVWIKEEEE